MAEIVGGKWLMGVGVLITAVFTLLTPVAASTNIYLLYTVRIIEGLGEGPQQYRLHSQEGTENNFIFDAQESHFQPFMR